MSDPVELLRELVAIESLSGGEAALAEHLVRRMRELGLDASVDGAGNAVGVKRGPPARGSRSGAAPDIGVDREIVLLGHMDTVPGRIAVRIDGDVLHGRGAVDAKGPLAAFVAAAARSTPAPGTAITVVGAVEEEAATSKGARFRAPLHRPAACIIGEPSGWDGITLGYKGRLLVDARFEQPGGHSAGPHRAVGERAIDLWNGVLGHCDAFNRGRERLFDQLMPSLRSIATSSDGLRDAAETTIGFRLPPDIDVAELGRAVRALAPDAELELYGAEAAWVGPRTSELARAFARAIRARDAEPRFKHKTGTSDMNVLGPVWGCPIVAYGPGDSALDHAPDERISIAEYLRSIDVLAETLVDAGFAT